MAVARRLFATAGLAAALASCESPLSYTDQKRLDLAEAKWEQRGFSDYAIEILRSCFCPPDLVTWTRVEVVGGVVQRAVIVSTGEVITDNRLGFWSTVEELFDQIRHAGSSSGLERVELEFDSALGFPTEIRWISSDDILDGGGIDRLRNAVPLP